MAISLKSLKKSFFPVLIKWIKSNLITVINTSTTVILIAIVITVLLTRAVALQRETTEEGIINIAQMTALEVQTNFLSYVNEVQTISQIMTKYETFDADQRRLVFNEIMYGLFVSNRYLLNIYSVWKPNVLDGLDASFAADDGSDTGQYLTGYTRELRYVQQREFAEYKYLLDMDFTDFRNGVINEPVDIDSDIDSDNEDVYVSERLKRWAVNVQFPIFRSSNSPELLGVIGASIDMDRIQFQVEGLRPFGSGGTFICSGNGVVIAHYDYRMRGLNINHFESGKLLFQSDRPDLISSAIDKSVQTANYEVISTSNALIVSYPLTSFKQNYSSRFAGIGGSINWAVVSIVNQSTILAPINILLRISVLFIIGAAVIMAFVVFITSRTLTQRAKALQRSLEQSTTMQDNLKYGLFMMDEKYVIQGAHSKALEKIFSTSDLQGKNFLDLISPSLREAEKQSLIDYFEMVYKNAFDKDLLDSINPIDDFQYISRETGETKNLRTTFSLAEHGIGARYILGTMEDITAEKQLQMQLMEAENLKENEMRALFQVIQIDPRVLRDFVVDAEYEFERINELLRNKKNLQHEVLVELYQAIHAIKSNALILNLEDFSDRLHKLESSIKALQEEQKDEVLFDDLLALILQLNDAMGELDQLKDTVTKIENFRVVSTGDRKQEKYVLVETLTRVCNKTQAALDKKVRFVVEGIDDVVLDNGPRRDIKEILTQLVRNAVYHGIERPEERTPLGKDAEGEIRLSIRYMENQIVIKLTDNGGGIDFGRIRQTAEEHNLVHSEDEANDKNYLLKTIFTPGFSTLDQADYHAGRGMGLSLVKDRIKDLHGNITVSTAKGKGTTFTITIPLELRVPAADNAS